MSAAPVPSPPAPQPRAPQICKIPLSVFERMLEECNYVKLRCFLLVLNDGSKNKWSTWTRITPEEFGEISVSLKEYAMEQVGELVQEGLIRVRYPGGKFQQRAEYSIAPDFVTESKGDNIQGRCKECKTIGEFKTEFIPVHREFITKCAPGLNHSAFVSLAVIVRFSHARAWDGKTLDPKWVELDRNDLEKRTGLDKGSITKALAYLLKVGAIERRDRAGRASLYRTIPENWADLGKQLRRVVTPPPRETEQQVKDRADKLAEKPIKAANTLVIESVSYKYGFCAHCCHIVEVEPVSDSERAALEEKPTAPAQPRAGPMSLRKPNPPKEDSAMRAVRLAKQNVLREKGFIE